MRHTCIPVLVMITCYKPAQTDTTMLDATQKNDAGKA
jgi:hypothetical protein